MSTQRAFVIQFLQRPGSDDGFTGRAEHVGSGETVHFTSPDELIHFLSRLNGGAEPPLDRPRARAAAASASGPARARRTRRPGPD